MAKATLTASVFGRVGRTEFVWGRMTERQRRECTKGMLDLAWGYCDAEDKARIARCLGI